MKITLFEVAVFTMKNMIMYAYYAYIVWYELPFVNGIMDENSCNPIRVKLFWFKKEAKEIDEQFFSRKVCCRLCSFYFSTLIHTVDIFVVGTCTCGFFSSFKKNFFFCFCAVVHCVYISHIMITHPSLLCEVGISAFLFCSLFVYDGFFPLFSSFLFFAIFFDLQIIWMESNHFWIEEKLKRKKKNVKQVIS